MPPLAPANHLIRARNVTASEVGALLGAHPFTTPGKIWDRLNFEQSVNESSNALVLAHGPFRPDPSLAMEFGSDAEPILRKFAERTLGCTIRSNPITYEHKRVRLCATPDAMVLRAATVFSLGQPRDLVEFKTSWSHNRWRDGLPPDIEWQCRAQLAVLRRSRCIVYVFSGSEKLYVVERHRGKERAMTQAVERFWADHVITGVRPEDVVKEVSFAV